MPVSSGCKLIHCFKKMAALRSSLETQQGVCGNSVIEQAWVECAADRYRDRMRGEHGAASLGTGVGGEIRTQGQAGHQAGGARSLFA